MVDDRSTGVVTQHRFFLPAERIDHELVRFLPQQSRQIERVLRLRHGDRVVVLDGSGAELEVELERLGREAEGRILRRERNSAEPAVAIDLYQGVLKGPKFELVLQKGTEVGVSRFVPVLSERSIPAQSSGEKRCRYQAIVREAAEQSRRGKIPEVAEALPFEAALRAATGAGLVVLLWEGETGSRLMDLTLPEGNDRVSVFVGPEGGFSEGEARRASALGAVTVTLGKRILRAETAGVVGPALLLARLGELG